jgi:hypothetical protein
MWTHVKWFKSIYLVGLLAVSGATPANVLAEGARTPAAVDARDLIRKISSDEFTERETAQKELASAVAEQPQEMLPLLIMAQEKAEDPDVAFRLNEAVFSVYRTRVINKPRGFLGIRLANSILPKPQANGQPEILQVVDVLDIIPDSAAEASDLQIRDKILSVDGLSVGPDNPDGGFIEYIFSKPPGTEVKMRVWRFGQEFDTTIKLGLRPPDLPLPRTMTKTPDDLYQEWLDAARTAIKNGEPVTFD